MTLIESCALINKCCWLTSCLRRMPPDVWAGASTHLEATHRLWCGTGRGLLLLWHSHYSGHGAGTDNYSVSRTSRTIQTSLLSLILPVPTSISPSLSSPSFPLSTFRSTSPCLLSSCFLFFLNSLSYCVRRTSTPSHPLSSSHLSLIFTLFFPSPLLSCTFPFLSLLIIPSLYLYLHSFLFDFLVLSENTHTCTHTCTYTHSVSLSNTDLPQNSKHNWTLAF